MKFTYHQLLTEAEKAHARGEMDFSEYLYEQSVYAAQADSGHHHPDVAKCLLAFALFLEKQNRIEDALLRYKLAASIYKQNGHAGAQSFANNNVQRLQQLLSPEDA